MAFHTKAPEAWFDVPAKERDRRALLGSDQCELDGKFFFLRGLLDIPVLDLDEPFVWGVWVCVSERDYLRARSVWTTEGRESEPPYVGWLSTQLAPFYPTTLNLKARLHTRPVGARPLVEMEPTDHPLAVEQREGISRERLGELHAALLHR
jgi:hypothetical protein